MIEDHKGRIDYAAAGIGPTVVFVPGSCSTGSAWKPIISAWGAGCRFVTTSLPGYGGTDERRTRSDPSMAHVADAVETVIRNTASTVHLVGHSFGGLAALAVALRKRVPMASLSILEPPAVDILASHDDKPELDAFRRMFENYGTAFAEGQRDAIAAMIDFYGGAGTFASWPERMCAYAMQTTHVNLLDWATAYGYALDRDQLRGIDVPTLLVCGAHSHSAMHRIIARLGVAIPCAETGVIDHAAHFMISTHATDVANLLRGFVIRAEGAAQLRPYAYL